MTKFYYSRLSDGEKNLYGKIHEALLRYEPALSVHAGMGKDFSVDTEKLLDAVFLDDPMLFHADRSRITVKKTPMYLQFGFSYIFEKDEAEDLRIETEMKIDGFITGEIRSDMSTLQKQQRIYSYVSGCSAAILPYSAELRTVADAVLKRRCADGVFASLYKLICDKVGIPSMIVCGDAVTPDGETASHRWNITEIDGVIAHSDACFESRFGFSGFDYFNLCDGDICGDHFFDSAMYPRCEPNTANYFSENGLIAESGDALCSLIAKYFDEPYFTVKLTFPFSEEEAMYYPFDIGTLRYNKAQNIISFSKAMIE